MEDSTKLKPECPEGGELGSDFRQYLNCGSCPGRRTCQRHHNERAERLQEEAKLFFLQSEAGLIYCNDLTLVEQRLIDYVVFRSLLSGYCQESGVRLARILRVGRSRISQWLGNKHEHSLVERGYLRVKQNVQPRKKPGNRTNEYRTNRIILPTAKTVRLLNLFRIDSDGLYSLSEGKLKKSKGTTRRNGNP